MSNEFVFKETRPYHFVMCIDGRQIPSRDEFIERFGMPQTLGMDVVHETLDLFPHKIHLQYVDFGEKVPTNDCAGYGYIFNHEIPEVKSILRLDGTTIKCNWSYPRRRWGERSERIKNFICFLFNDNDFCEHELSDKYPVCAVKSNIGGMRFPIFVKCNFLYARCHEERSNYGRLNSFQSQTDEYGLHYTTIKARFLTKKLGIREIGSYGGSYNGRCVYGVNRVPYVFFFSLGDFDCRLYKLHDFIQLARLGQYRFENGYYNEQKVIFRLCEHYKKHLENIGFKRLDTKFKNILRCFGFYTRQSRTDETVQVGWSMFVSLLLEYESKIIKNGRKC